MIWAMLLTGVGDAYSCTTKPPTGALELFVTDPEIATADFGPAQRGRMPVMATAAGELDPRAVSWVAAVPWVAAASWVAAVSWVVAAAAPVLATSAAGSAARPASVTAAAAAQPARLTTFVPPLAAGPRPDDR